MFIKILTTMTLLIFTISSYAEDFNYLSIVEGASLGSSKGNSIGVGNEADLYQQISKEFNLVYESIGKSKAEGILAGNGLSVTGGLNSIGLSSKKPFLNFNVSGDRNLAPNLFDDKLWIVTDTFNVDIDASKVLGGLRDSGAIKMSEQNLAAFAGVVFKRKFTWIHYANSYQEGLSSHFEKLFLPFNSLAFSNIAALEANEMIFKEDSISVKGGGLVTAPLYSGVTGAAGVLAKFEKLSRVEVVSLEGSNLQISSEKSTIGTLGTSLSVQADFLKLLRLTLLSYDFSYELESSYKIYMNINQLELVGLDEQAPIVMEVTQILKNREADLDVLAPYIISEEKRITQTIKHKYNFLLLGAQKSSKTQQIEITKDGKVKNFFRHYYEKMMFTEDALSRFFASIIYAVTNSDVTATQLVSDTKKVTIEYDSEKNLLETRDNVNIGEVSSSEQKLSMTFKSDFKTRKTTGRSGKKYKERAIFILERFTGVDPLALGMIERDYLKAPYHVEGSYQVNIEGIRFLNKQSTDTVFNHFDGLCNEYPKKGLINFRNIFDNCRRALQNDYIDYLKDLTHNRVSADEIVACEKKAKMHKRSNSKKRAFVKACIADLNLLSKEEWTKVPLWPLKNLSNNIVGSSYSKVHFYNLFGIQNVFFFGSFNAVTADGRAFTTSFHEGAFKGLGAVDHYMRVENLRAPSSIVLDQ